MKDDDVAVLVNDFVVADELLPLFRLFRPNRLGAEDVDGRKRFLFPVARSCALASPGARGRLPAMPENLRMAQWISEMISGPEQRRGRSPIPTIRFAGDSTARERRPTKSFTKTTTFRIPAQHRSKQGGMVGDPRRHHSEEMDSDDSRFRPRRRVASGTASSRAFRRSRYARPLRKGLYDSHGRAAAVPAYRARPYSHSLGQTHLAGG